MNKMTDVEFPPWVVRNCINKIYNRQRKRSEKTKITHKRNIKTWQSSCLRALNKIYYRQKGYLEGKIERNDWQNCINSQLSKLMKRHDPIYLWGICEYRNLEKLNEFEFVVDKSRSSIWQLKAIDEVADIKKRIKSTRPKLVRTERSSWTDVIGNIRTHLKTAGTYEYTKKDEWDLCYRYNSAKLAKIIGYVGWDSRISQNKKKINKLIQSQPELESELL